MLRLSAQRQCEDSRPQRGPEHARHPPRQRRLTPSSVRAPHACTRLQAEAAAKAPSHPVQLVRVFAARQRPAQACQGQPGLVRSRRLVRGCVRGRQAGRKGGMQGLHPHLPLPPNAQTGPTSCSLASATGTGPTAASRPSSSSGASARCGRPHPPLDHCRRPASPQLAPLLLVLLRRRRRAAPTPSRPCTRGACP